MRNDMISIQQQIVWTNKCKLILILSDCVMNGIIMSGIMFLTAMPLDTREVPGFEVMGGAKWIVKSGGGGGGGDLFQYAFSTIFIS